MSDLRDPTVEPSDEDSLKQVLLDIRRLLLEQRDRDREQDRERKSRPVAASPKPLTPSDVVEIVKYELNKIPIPPSTPSWYPWYPPSGPSVTYGK